MSSKFSSAPLQIFPIGADKTTIFMNFQLQIVQTIRTYDPLQLDYNPIGTYCMKTTENHIHPRLFFRFPIDPIPQ